MYRWQYQRWAKPLTPPGEEGERITPDKWLPPIQNPPRRANSLIAAIVAGSFFFGQPPIIRADQWQPSYPDIVRTRKPLVNVGWQVVDPTQLTQAERTTPDKWHPLIQQPRRDLARNQYLFPSFFSDAQLFTVPGGEVVTVDKWFTRTSEPIRVPARLREYPFFTIDASQLTQGERITQDKWQQPQSTPRRDLKRWQSIYPYLAYTRFEEIVTVDKWHPLPNQPYLSRPSLRWMFPSLVHEPPVPGDIKVSMWYRETARPIWRLPRLNEYPAAFIDPSSLTLPSPNLGTERLFIRNVVKRTHQRIKTIVAEHQNIQATVKEHLMLLMISYNPLILPIGRIRKHHGQPVSVTEFVTSTGTWSRNTDGSNITVQCIGGGGGGSNGLRVSGQQSGAGGGGGEYRQSVVSYTSGTVLNVVVGAGGAGAAPTSPNGAIGSNGGNTSFNAAQVIANGGKGGATVTNGVGGLGGSGGTGTVGNNGGNGGGSGSAGSLGNGGGGAGGPNGVGGNGGTQSAFESYDSGGGGNGGGANAANAGVGGPATAGGNNYLGYGGGAGGVFPGVAGLGVDGGGGGGGYDFGSSNTNGRDGGNGIDFNATHGSGGGGGSSQVNNTQSGNGGLYGGGGGGGGVTCQCGNGGQGIIAITYQTYVIEEV